MNPELLLPAAFLAGLFGSSHCIGMCGAIVVLFEGQPSATRGAWSRRALYNSGRLGFYMLLGTIAGIGGSLITRTAGVEAGLAVLRIAAGLLVIALGLNLTFDWQALAILERSGARIWKRVAPLTRHVLPVDTPGRAVAAGFLWGALPCGLVYSAVGMAATGGDPLTGALVMFAFWLGTAPALLLAGASAARLAVWRRQGAVRRAAGMVLLVLGVLALAFPLLRMAGDGQHMHQL
jgi:sulfite exporter TauE/SafE